MDHKNVLCPGALCAPVTLAHGSVDSTCSGRQLRAGVGRSGVSAHGRVRSCCRGAHAQDQQGQGRVLSGGSWAGAGSSGETPAGWGLLGGSEAFRGAGGGEASE